MKAFNQFPVVYC